MKSGLGDRNNAAIMVSIAFIFFIVSMKSGLRDRNNDPAGNDEEVVKAVSMKSGLRDRNNEYR